MRARRAANPALAPDAICMKRLGSKRSRASVGSDLAGEILAAIEACGPRRALESLRQAAAAVAPSA